MLSLSRTRTCVEALALVETLVLTMIISPVRGAVALISPFPTFPLRLLDVASHSRGWENFSLSFPAMGDNSELSDRA